MAIDGAELIERFELQDAVPELTPDEQQAAQEYLTSQAMTAVFGTVDLGSEETPASKKLLLSHEPNSARYLALPGAVVGPYFIGSDYNSRGICVWTPADDNRG